jgi:lysophospholipase L1-like esterase
MTRSLFPLLILAIGAVCAAAEPSPREYLEKSKRIVFLGDSITAAGVYVAGFETWLLMRKPASPPTVINAGLPSETVSGLSEEGHAGGKFPRPDLAERLDRVLAVTKPDLVIACYGINCGIYQPFDAERFAKYQQGMQKLKKKVEDAGAKLIVVTPPFYDDKRAPKSFSYNEVLDRYSAWLLDQRANNWRVIDLHGPMTKAIREARVKDPEFTFQPDGVHPNAAGSWFLAQQLIAAFGGEAAAKAESPEALLKAAGKPVEVFRLIQQRGTVLRDAYVGAAGHKRPGIAKGLPVEEAETKAAAMLAEIQKLLMKN